MSSRGAYGGTTRKLVLAFDVGTTYSGISYSILDPGQVPGIKGVTKFPAQEHITGASKIPTVIYYDRIGKVCAAGAETLREGIFEMAEEGNWVKAEWFKLHLRSKDVKDEAANKDIPAIPDNKTVVGVFSDYLRYLHECAAKYIQETHANGPTLWASLKDSIDFVLSHPNGWEGKEQSLMRRAAVLAGLVPDTSAGQARISFVTEGEASLHFAIESGILAKANIQGGGLAIVDAGGGTIDISIYREDTDGGAKVFKEIAAAECYFAGSVYVGIAAKVFLRQYLSDSVFLDDIGHIARTFDRSTKLRFRNANDPQYIKFGNTRDNDLEHGIRFGQLKLLGSDVATFFEPSIQCIFDAVAKIHTVSANKIEHVILVGGFAASDYLFERVNTSLSKIGLTVIRPENHINKAVSDGAVSFYLNRYVRTRVAKVTYGTTGSPSYNPCHPEHLKRSALTYTSPSGSIFVSNGFFSLVNKNTQVSEAQEYRVLLTLDVHNKTELSNVNASIYSYRGAVAKPEWIDVDAGNYKKLCTVSANLVHLPLNPHRNSSGQTYYQTTFHVVMLFGLTELKAHIAWTENGIERRSQAKIIYDEDE